MSSSSRHAMPTGSIFDPGVEIYFVKEGMDFEYGPGVFGPKPEYRTLDSIRASLRDPNCEGPDPVYAIVMDVGRIEDRDELNKRMLLFGVVMYAAGKLGDSPVRSQGHVHTVAPHCGWSTPELFEIWEGRAVIYGQEKSGDDPGRCVAIEAGPGECVVMPPGWSHYAVNASANSRLIFGAWCDRQYGFDYTQMRARKGLAWLPVFTSDDNITWQPNPNYDSSKIEQRKARTYPELGLSTTIPIYRYISENPEAIQWIADPARFRTLWPHFEI